MWPQNSLAKMVDCDFPSNVCVWSMFNGSLVVDSRLVDNLASKRMKIRDT